MRNAPSGASNQRCYAVIPMIISTFKGYVSFTAKTMLIEHYQKTLGAINIGGNLMVIKTEAALKLIDKYFKN